MKPMSARELKNSTGDVIRTLRRGESILLTFRGKPFLFLWSPSADFALDRVAERVRSGGHDVPAEAVRRRHRVGLRNFFHLYEPLLSGWLVQDNSGPRPRSTGSWNARAPFLADEDLAL